MLCILCQPTETARADSFSQFRRYNQSDVTLKGRSRIKSGWWAGAREAQVEGREVLVLHYDGPYAAATKVRFMALSLTAQAGNGCNRGGFGT